MNWGWDYCILLYISPSTNSATLRETSFTSNLSPFITILVASDFSIVLGGLLYPAPKMNPQRVPRNGSIFGWILYPGTPMT